MKDLTKKITLLTLLLSVSVVGFANQSVAIEKANGETAIALSENTNNQDDNTQAVNANPIKTEPKIEPATEKKAGLASLFKAKPKFLPVHQAFSLNAKADDKSVQLSFKVTPAHYVYQDKLKLTLPKGVSAGVFSFNQKSNFVDDPDFGRVAVFEQDFVATAPLINETNEPIKGEIKIQWQGCAVAGLCYPPENQKISIELPANPKAVQANSDKKDNPNTQKTDNKNFNEKSNIDDKKLDEKNTKNSDNKNPVADNKTAQDNSKENPKNNTKDNTITDNSIGENSNALNKNNNQGDDNKGDDNLPLTTISLSNALSDELSDNVSNELSNQSSEKSPNELSDESNPVNLGNQNRLNQNTNQPTAHYSLNHQLVGGISDPFGLANNPILAIGLLFVAGLTLAFTACVYPMIPIVANLIANDQKNGSNSPNAPQKSKPLRGFVLTTAYGLGVATAYGLLGMLIAWLGRTVGIIGWLQNPYVLMGSALLFVVLGLVMLGVVNIRLPVALANKLNNASRLADNRLGSVGGSFLVGLLSALVVSPCVSAPLGGALFAVSAIGNMALGFFALFALGFGLSVPLIIMGTVQGKFMPKSGAWLDKTKEFGGLLLFGVAILLANRVVLSPIMLGVWAVWFAVFAVWVFRTHRLVLQGLGVLLGIWSALLLAGMTLGASNAWQPLAPLLVKNSNEKSITYQDKHITALAELDTILATHDKVLIDLTAEWCIECKIMEQTLFTNRPVGLGDWQVVKLDITETSDESRAILARYGLFGPPALLYYKKGEWVNRQLGEVARGDFEQALKELNQ